MKTINIAPYIKELNIFDDPEYCRGESGFCGKLFRSSGVYYCGLFDRRKLEELDIKNHGIFPIKCGKCKEIYQRILDEAHGPKPCSWCGSDTDLYGSCENEECETYCDI